MLAKKVSLGKLPLPVSAAPSVARIIREGDNPLSIDLPDYVKVVNIKEGKLVITVGSK